MKKAGLTFLTVALLAVSAPASVTYAPQLFGTAYDASGAPIQDGTYLMVLDLDNDGWQGFAYLEQGEATANNAADWQWDADDYVMDRGQITNGEAYPFAQFAAASVDGYDVGVDHYYVLWFDVPFDAGAAGPGAGVDYGVVDAGVAGADPGNYGELYFTPMSANLATVPEPATLALLGCGGLLVGLRRRNSR